MGIRIYVSYIHTYIHTGIYIRIYMLTFPVTQPSRLHIFVCLCVYLFVICGWYMHTYLCYIRKVGHMFFELKLFEIFARKLECYTPIWIFMAYPKFQMPQACLIHREKNWISGGMLVRVPVSDQHFISLVWPVSKILTSEASSVQIQNPGDTTIYLGIPLFKILVT